MRGKLYHSFVGSQRSKVEFRRQLRLLIVATLGFTIAFTWRQTIFDASKAIVKLLTNIQSSTTLSLLSSIFITLISLVLIYLASKFLKDSPENY